MRKFAAIILLWIPFSIAALVSIPALLWGLLTEDESVWKPIGRSMDKLLATLLGYSGNYTLSAELGASTDYGLLRKLLNFIEPYHCEKSAKNEGRQ